MKLSVRVILILSIAVVLTFCTHNNKQIPSDLIQKDEFIEIMVDVQLVESINKIKHERQQADYNLGTAYKWIYSKYGITEDELTSSFDYYATDPEEFEQIYDAVITRISEMEAGKE